jgi:hypothetical protein
MNAMISQVGRSANLPKDEMQQTRGHTPALSPYMWGQPDRAGVAVPARGDWGAETSNWRLVIGNWLIATP